MLEAGLPNELVKLTFLSTSHERSHLIAGEDQGGSTRVTRIAYRYTSSSQCRSLHTAAVLATEGALTPRHPPKPRGWYAVAN